MFRVFPALSPSGCPKPNTLPCGDGACYHKDLKCDMIYDCPNLEDELSCPETTGTFTDRLIGSLAYV